MRFRGPLPEEVLPVGRACGAVLPSAACSVAVSVAQAVQVRAPHGAAWALELLKGWLVPRGRAGERVWCAQCDLD